MRKLKTVGSQMLLLVCGVAAFALLARDVFRVATVPPLAARLPEPLPPETVHGFRNHYYGAYAAHLSVITARASPGWESWHVDGSGYRKSGLYGRWLEERGKRLSDYDVRFDFGTYRNDTHCFSFNVAYLPDTPIGVAFGNDTATGAVALPVDGLMVATLAAKGAYGSGDADYADDGVRFTGRYRIPASTAKATVSLGIASRRDAVLWSETPLPNRYGGGRKVGADVQMRLGCPPGSKAYFIREYDNRMITLTLPALPNADAPLPPYAYAIYAVDEFGKEYWMHSCDYKYTSGKKIGFVCDDLPRKRTQSVRVLVAPLAWTRFVDVPLRVLVPKP